jgi:hypothetical protein
LRSPPVPCSLFPPSDREQVYRQLRRVRSSWKLYVRWASARARATGIALRIEVLARARAAERCLRTSSALHRTGVGWRPVYAPMIWSPGRVLPDWRTACSELRDRDVARRRCGAEGKTATAKVVVTFMLASPCSNLE